MTSNDVASRAPGTSDSVPDPDLPVALSITNLHKSFGGREVVKGLSLSARLGHVTAVLGPNGAGKTTTIECCEGLRTPDSGDIRIFGLDPARDGARLRSRVGVMLQDGGLPTSVRALDMLKHVSRMYASPWDVSDLVERLGIDSFASTTVRRLSGGQRQRLALAAALVGRPSLLFLDEPSAGMDPQSRHAVWELVRQLRDEGAAILLTTHLMDEAQALSDQVYIVDRGEVIAQGAPHELGATLDDQLTFHTDRTLGMDQLDSLVESPGQVTRLASGAYRVTGLPIPAAIAQVAGACARHDITITSLTSGVQNLEDVFLDLTGRSLR